MVLWMIGLGLGDEGDISVKGLKAVQQTPGGSGICSPFCLQHEGLEFATALWTAQERLHLLGSAAWSEILLTFLWVL